MFFPTRCTCVKLYNKLQIQIDRYIHTYIHAYEPTYTCTCIHAHIRSYVQAQVVWRLKIIRMKNGLALGVPADPPSFPASLSSLAFVTPNPNAQTTCTSIIFVGWCVRGKKQVKSPALEKGRVFGRKASVGLVWWLSNVGQVFIFFKWRRLSFQVIFQKRSLRWQVSLAGNDTYDDSDEARLPFLERSRYWSNLQIVATPHTETRVMYKRSLSHTHIHISTHTHEYKHTHTHTTYIHVHVYLCYIRIYIYVSIYMYIYM